MNEFTNNQLSQKELKQMLLSACIKKKSQSKIKIYKQKYIKHSSSSDGSSGGTEYAVECNNCQGIYFEIVNLCIHANTDRDCGAWARRCESCRTIESFVACFCPEDPPIVTAAPAAPSL